MTARGPVREAAALTCVLGVAAALRVWAFSGVQFAWLGDDGRYAAAAQNLANGFAPHGPAEWFGGRVGFLWPVAFAFRRWGASDVTAVAWPFLGSLLAVVAAHLVGRHVGGRWVGILAAGLVAVSPLEIEMATRLRPDALMPGLVALAVWSAVRAADGARPAPWALSAGLWLGLAWSVREMALVMIPVVALAGWGARRAAWWALAGLAAAPVAAAALMWLAGGDPLLPLTGTAGASRGRDPVAAWDWGASYAHRLIHAAADPGEELFLLLPVAVLAAVTAAVARDRRALLPAAWLAWAAVYLEFGTLANLDKAPRFLLLGSIPLAVLVALAASRLPAPVRPAVVAAPLLAAVLALAPVPAREHRGTDVVLLTRVLARLRTLPPGPVVAESFTWQQKLTTYTAATRLAIPAADDPAFLDAAQRQERARMEPLPDVTAARGGYVVDAPVVERAGWPRNWSAHRRAIRAQVPWESLVPVARVGDAVILRWPPGVPPGPAP